MSSLVTFSGGPRVLNETIITFPSPASTLSFVASLSATSVVHSNNESTATVTANGLVGGNSFSCLYVDLDADGEDIDEPALLKFYNNYSSPSFDGDFSRGVILLSSTQWNKQNVWDTYHSLCLLCMKQQLENHKTSHNGSGGTPVGLRPVWGSGEEAAAVFEDEVLRRRETGGVGGKKWQRFSKYL